MTERKVQTFSFEEFHDKLFPGRAYIAPFSGRCILCAKQLAAEDTDHSVCNKCWDETFAEEEENEPVEGTQYYE